MPSTTNNMGLKIPLAGETDYATSVSDTITSVDNHDHSSGKGTQVDSAGIADGAISAAKLASDAVTTAKILDANVTTAKIAALAVTRAKQAAVGHQTSSTISGTFNSGTYADLTNATISITTTGRPVLLMLIPVPGTPGFGAEFLLQGPGQLTLNLKLLRGATIVFEQKYDFAPNATQTGTPDITFVPSIMFDAPAAGTYTYKIQYNVNQTLFVSDYKLVAFEL